MKSTIKLLALILAFLMLLTSCDFAGTGTDTETESVTVAETVLETGSETESETEPEEETVDEKAEYRASISRTREEVESMITLKEGEFESAQALLDEFESLATVSTDYEAVDAVYMEFEDMFYYLDTQISLANIIYDLNRNDKAASSRYLDNYELYGDLYNEYMFACKNVYNESPIRDQLFADWTEEDIKMLLSYDPQTQELREKNEELLVEFNEITGVGASQKKAEIYVQIIQNNNRIAELSGYDNYYLYATTEIYGRDYSLDEIAAFKSNVREIFMPKLDMYYNGWYNRYAKLDSADQDFMIDFLYEPFDELDKNYLEGYVNSYDNSTGEGFKDLFINRNMIFTSSPNSHDSAYQTYLEDYETPFCLFGSEGQSTSTIVHEMGHYYASLYTPHVSSYDVAETQSQANEFLFMNYAKSEMPNKAYAAIRAYNCYNTVAMIIICAIIDDFEQKVYSLDSVEGFGYSDFKAIMEEVCEPYGGTSVINSKITNINEYWLVVCPNSPVYYISYATSSMAALSIYAVAEADQAEGREIYRKLIEETEENEGFKSALTKIGLKDPFKKETFEEISLMLSKK